MIDAAVFEAERAWLTGVAYRMLGSAADAEDVVQEAFLRAADAPDPRTPRAWLTTVVTRLCIDEVRSGRRKREGYVGEWLPEPVATDVPTSDERVVVAESMSMAFLVLLERLSPLERAVFVLHEVFDFTMPEVSEAVGRNDAACRQLLHRAREHVSSRRRARKCSAEALDSAVGALMMALATGDLDALKSLLLDDVGAVSDHGGKASAVRRMVVGADPVARLLVGLGAKLARIGGTSRAVWLNGEVAFVVVERGAVTSAVLPELVDVGGIVRVAAVRMVRNPDKLARLNAALGTGALREFNGYGA